MKGKRSKKRSLPDNVTCNFEIINEIEKDHRGRPPLKIMDANQETPTDLGFVDTKKATKSGK